MPLSVVTLAERVARCDVAHLIRRIAARPGKIRLTFGAVLAAVLAACADQTVAPPPNAARATLSVSAPDSEVSGGPVHRGVVHPRFGAVTVEPVGVVRPGHAARVRVRVRALVRTPRATVSLILPDSRPRPVRGPRGVDSLRLWNGSIARGAGLDLQGAVTFREPGYYRVLAVVRSPGERGVGAGSPEDTLTYQNTVVGELWVRVRADAGLLNVNGSGGPAVPVEGQEAAPPPPGPEREWLTPAARGGAGDAVPAVIPPCESDCNGPTPPGGGGNGNIQGTAYYLNTILHQWLPQENAAVQVGGSVTYTDQNGAFSIPGCPAAGTTKTLTVQSRSATVSQKWNGSAVISSYTLGESACYSQLILNAMNLDAASLYANMHRVISSTLGFMGPEFVRSGVQQVAVTTSNAEGSQYDPLGDVLLINKADAVETEGLYSAAHEYAHAVHEKRLGGLRGYPSIACGNHRLSTVTTLGCAWVEGYAIFHATYALKSDAGYRYYNVVADSSWSPTPGDGSVVEGAVAAFLYDLLDVDGPDVVTRAGSFYEAVQMPPAELASVIQNCRIRTASGGYANTVSRVDGVDYLIYCLERAVKIDLTRGVRKCPKNPVSSTTGCSMPSSYSSFKPTVDATVRDQYFMRRRPQLPVSWADAASGFTVVGTWIVNSPFSDGTVPIPERALWLCDLYGRCSTAAPGPVRFDVGPSPYDSQIPPEG